MRYLGYSTVGGVSMTRVAFGVIMKAPLEGFVKTRLTPPLTKSQAADLHRCFVRDTCENLAQVAQKMPVDVFAVYTPLGSEATIRELVPADFRLLLQRGEGFGDRLFYAAQDLLGFGYGAAILTDSDSPTVPTASLELAAETLLRRGDRAAIGPCEDGGYYLLGLKAAHLRLFQDIDWSTDGVCVQTCDRAREISLEMTVLPPWYDVDDARSLKTLHSELFDSSNTGRYGYDASHTKRYLEELPASEPIAVSVAS